VLALPDITNELKANGFAFPEVVVNAADDDAEVPDENSIGKNESERDSESD
jgi:hypothetical protein